MMVVEALMLTILMMVLVSAAYTDCRTGIIKNKLIAFFLFLAIPFDAVYYGIFAQAYFQYFLMNLLLVTLCAVFFYAYHLWAAGDSKLFFLVALWIPARFYTFWHIGRASSFIILTLIFCLAFLYVIGETIILGIREKNLFSVSVGKIKISSMVLSYISMVAMVIVGNWAIWRVFSQQLSNDRALTLAVNFFVVLSLLQVRERLSDKTMFVVSAACWGFLLILIAVGLYQFEGIMDIRSWLIVLAVMAARVIAEKYNYKVIPTQDIRAGQILSAATILMFEPSRVKGLPEQTTEDLRSRISEEEADSIRRWENSKYGKPYIVIVRKIPFAIFICVGTVTFLVIGVILA